MSLGVIRSTVAEHPRRASVVGITCPVPEEMDHAELERRLFTPPSFEAKSRAQRDWYHVHEELTRLRAAAGYPPLRATIAAARFLYRP